MIYDAMFKSLSFSREKPWEILWEKPCLGKTLDKTSCSTQTDSRFHDPTPFDQGARYEARLLTFQGKTIQISMPGG